MNKPNQGTGGAGGGEASGKHQGLRQPAEDHRTEDAVDNIGLKDSSATLEDRLRDKRGNGVRGGYDDSIDGQAGDGPVSDAEVARAPRDT